MEMHNVLCAVQSKKNKKPTNAFIATTTYIDHKPRNNAQQWLWLDSECWTPHATCYLYLASRFCFILFIFIFWLLAFGFWLLLLLLLLLLGLGCRWGVGVGSVRSTHPVRVRVRVRAPRTAHRAPHTHRTPH
jgi:hypothetical protein